VQPACLSNDTGVQRRTREGAKRPTRPSDCNAGLARTFPSPDAEVRKGKEYDRIVSRVDEHTFCILNTSSYRKQFKPLSTVAGKVRGREKKKVVLNAKSTDEIDPTSSGFRKGVVGPSPQEHSPRDRPNHADVGDNVIGSALENDLGAVNVPVIPTAGKTEPISPRIIAALRKGYGFPTPGAPVSHRVSG
jgi:hypothetical protein